VQSNQFLLVNGGTGAILDPGGNLAYHELYLGMSAFFPPHKLAAILASHADPDIIASLDRWMTATEAPVYISRLWERFAPHFCKPGKTLGRIVGLPDAGERLQPAHFLHAEGNFQFYDPVSRILFSGDLGASLGISLNPEQPVTSLAGHIPRMEGFHRRYMVSNKVLRLWAAMVRQLDIAMIAPQHGAPIVGAAVGEFIDWAEQLACGIDLFGAENYRVPG
jgi:flavorubredoxin